MKCYLYLHGTYRTMYTYPNLLTSVKIDVRNISSFEVIENQNILQQILCELKEILFKSV